MTKRYHDDDDRPASSFNGDEEDPFYKVGYKKPPRRTQFQKGNKMAANRKKKKASLTTAILQVLDEKTEVVISGRKVKMSNRDLIARRIVQDAMSGKASAVRASRLLLSIGNEDEPVIPDTTINIKFVPPMALHDPRRQKLLGNKDEDGE